MAGHFFMLSRVADSIFWMSRYMERTNALLRTVKTSYIASQDDMPEFQWPYIVDTYARHEHASTKDATPQQIMHLLILDKENVASVFNNVLRARENARSVQDNITKEVWQNLNDFYHLFKDSSIEYHLTVGDPVTSLDTLMRHAMLYVGTVDTTMARGEGYNFLNLAKYLERAVQTVNLFQSRLQSIQNGSREDVPTAWKYFLYSLSGYELYLKTHRSDVQPEVVARQTLNDVRFPHSVLYCLNQIRRYFDRFQQDAEEESYRKMDFLIGKTANLVRYSGVNAGYGPALDELLKQTRISLNEIANGFDTYYFGIQR